MPFPSLTEEQEVFYPLYSRLSLREIMYNLNNNERKNNSIIAAVITKTARKGERRRSGGLRKK
jgi:hypothetical protein